MRTKIAFKVKFFIIPKRLSVAKNGIRLENASLRGMAY